VPEFLEAVRQGRPDPAASHDHDMHGWLVSFSVPGERYTVRPPEPGTAIA
jgi:hypothetical protein